MNLYNPIIILLLFSCINVHAQKKNNIKKINKIEENKNINSWFTETINNQHLNIKPHPSINKNRFKEEYSKNKSYWDSAFSFLQKMNLETMAPGKYPIIGESVFATIAENDPKSKDELQWESHRKYIDLHHVIKGKEIIGMTNIASATVTKDYTFDIMQYKADGNYFESDSTIFFLAFPEDIHMPNIKSNQGEKVKKLVIKIEVSEQLIKKN